MLSRKGVFAFLVISFSVLAFSHHVYAFGSKQNIEAQPAETVDTIKADDTTTKKVELKDDDRVLGKADAPVTILEYASFTCSHCADFHEETMPLIKRDYIATGKAKYVYRDFPLDRMSLDAAVMARCADKERYFGLTQMLFKNQTNWSGSPQYLKALRQIGAIAGLPPEKFEACMADEKLRKDILESRVDAEKTYGINSTPTFIVFGKDGQETLKGNQPYKVFRETLDRLGAKHK